MSLRPVREVMAQGASDLYRQALKIGAKRAESKASPSSSMIRRTWGRGRLVSHSWLARPASRFELSASFSMPGA